MLRLHVRERLSDCVYWASGNSRFFQAFQPFGSRARPHALGNGFDHGFAVRDTSGIGGETLVAGPLGMSAYFGEARELAVVADRNDDPLVRRLERLVGNDVRVGIALPRRILAGDEGI